MLAFLSPLARLLGKAFLPSISTCQSVDLLPLPRSLRRPMAGTGFLVLRIGDGIFGASNPVSTQLGFLVLACVAYGRMAMLIVRVSVPGSDPPQVYLLGRVGQSSCVDSCQVLGAARLRLLAVCRQLRYLVSCSLYSYYVIYHYFFVILYI